MNNPQLFRQPSRFTKQANTWYSGSGFLLYLLPLLAIPATIKAFIHGNLFGIVINAACYAIYLFAANQLSQGLQAENAYLEKNITLAPKWPRKTLAALIIGANTFLLAWLGAHNPLPLALAFGFGATLGMYLSYGFDPRRAKTVAGNHGYSTAEIISIIDSAKQLIASIENANRQIDNREFNARIARICITADNILAELEANPAAIRRMRKFLLIYLEGTQKVTSGYANTHIQVTKPLELEQNFRNVLDSIETVFQEQKEKLLQEDLFDLDVQIEVLKTQLQQQGVL